MSAAPQKLRTVLENVVRAMDPPALLFSGGLDTSILAFLAAKEGLAGITVAVAGQSKDEPFAARAAKAFGLAHVWVRPDYEGLLGVLPQTIKLLKSFDPMTIRN